MRLVTGDDYAPFTGKTLPAGGMLTQVVQAALQHSGVEYSLAWRPWKRGYVQTLSGGFDATFPYVKTAEREVLFLYSQPIFHVEQYIFSRAGDVIEITEKASMRGRSLCYPLGWQPPANIQQMLDDGELSRHAPVGLKECARLLLMGRDDFFISDRLLGETALQLSGVPAEKFRRSNTAVGHNALHLIVPREHAHGAEIIGQFNRGLTALKTSGDYQRLLENYLHQRGGSIP